MAISVRLAEWSFPAIDRKRVLGIILALVAALLVLAVTRPEPQVPVLIASGDLVAGQALTADDVTVRYMASSEGLVEGTGLGDLSDWSLRVPLQAGEPLLPSLLLPPEMLVAPNVIALSLDQSHAVLGRLVAGDRVDVYRTTDGGFDAAPVTELVAAGVYVVESRTDTDGLNSGRVDLLLAVDEDLALLIAGSARHGEVDLVRVAP
jgi:Flp pilus assembly protein CpaB